VSIFIHTCAQLFVREYLTLRLMLGFHHENASAHDLPIVQEFLAKKKLLIK
jgi:hypothetical protein